MRFETILHQFLEETGNTDSIIMGARRATEVTSQQKETLVDNLLRENSFNKKLIILITSMFICVFLIGLFFAFYYRDKPTVLGIIFGGSFLTILGVIKGLQDLWREKTKTDMVLTLITNITPEQSVAVIETLLYGEKKKKSKTSIS